MDRRQCLWLKLYQGVTLRGWIVNSCESEDRIHQPPFAEKGTPLHETRRGSSASFPTDKGSPHPRRGKRLNVEEREWWTHWEARCRSAFAILYAEGTLTVARRDDADSNARGCIAPFGFTCRGVEQFGSSLGS